jgi:hypothetical protein
MPGYHGDIGLAIKKYVGEFTADVAGRSGKRNLHGIFLLTVEDVQGMSRASGRQLRRDEDSLGPAAVVQA